MFVNYLRKVGPFRGIVAALSAIVIIFNLLTQGVEFSNQISSIIAALLAALALVGVGSPSPKMSVETDMRKIAEEVRDVWKEQERKRGLSDTSFVPLRVKIISGLDRNQQAGEFLRTPAKSPLWNLDDMRRSCAAAVYRFNVRRTVIFGAPGAGKSTLAIALTLGLLERYFDKRGDLVPVSLSLNSWDARRDTFEEWINRRLETTYPILRSFKRGEGGIARALSNTERFVFILDGLDEIADNGNFKGALKSLEEFFPERQRLCILARDRVFAEVKLGSVARLRLCGSTRVAVRNYLTALSAADSSMPGLDQLRMAVKTGRAARRSALVKVLRTPLYLRSAYHAILEESLTVNQVVATAQAGGERALKERLLSAEVDRALTRAPILQSRRAMFWLTYMAEDMERRGYQSYAWWRVGDAIPRPALVAMATTLLAPAYLLATVMPVGLTRGLAVGASVGAMAGVLRGYKVSISDVAIAAPIGWLIVFGLGYSSYGPSQAIADATELTVGVLLVLPVKELLMQRRLHVVLIAILGISSLAAASVAAVSFAIDFRDPYRTPRDILIGVLIGIGVAVVAGRLLIAQPRTQMQASRIRLTLAKRITSPVKPILAAVFAASLIGVGGGLGGGIRFGQYYGFSLILFFGATIGIPVGIVGGLVKWLSLPLAAGSAQQGSSPSTVGGAPLQSDRIVAIASMVGLAAAATGAIGVFIRLLGGPLELIQRYNPPGFSLQPIQGILYGLMMGVVVACFFTAWPTYFIAHLWLVCVGRKYPWQHQTFLDALVNVNLMRNEGPLIYFRHQDLQAFLGRNA